MDYLIDEQRTKRGTEDCLKNMEEQEGTGQNMEGSQYEEFSMNIQGNRSTKYMELPVASTSEIKLLYSAVMQGNTAQVRLLLKDKNFNAKMIAKKIKQLYKQIDGKEKEMWDIRKEFFQHFQKKEVHPLSCKGDRCASCRNSDRRQKTCLPFIQELFLWSLHTQSIELALVFWEHCEDKTASALVAWALKTAMSSKKKEQDQKWQLEEDAMQFQQLAVSTLKRCDEVNCTVTESLLTKPCPWWNNLSVLQLVVELENRDFMAQTACTKFMTRLWIGDTNSDLRKRLRPDSLVDADPDSDRSCCRFLERAPFRYLNLPVVRYVWCMVQHLTFLGLFSYVLLFSFQKEPAPNFLVLIVWVVDITAQKVIEAMNLNPPERRKCCPCREQCKSYWRQTWNWLDVLTIMLFGVGMLVFHDNEVLHIIGRTVLCVDLFFFCIRLLQLLMVFEELGLMLVMIRKMIRDTINFMFILLLFVLAYAVSSEALLYGSDRELVPRHVFLILRKAYWQVFGELFLDEIESDCDRNRTIFYGEKACPTSYGRYAVPVMLGIYIMITNVLLLNLLIARFNKTFEEVHDQAVEYQTWHRSLIIIEFHQRPHLPPPCNIFYLALGLTRYWIVACVTYCCRSKSRADDMTIKYQDNQRKTKLNRIRTLEEEQATWARDDAKARLIIAIDKKRKNKNSLVLIYKKLEEMQQQMNEISTVLERLKT